jgi:two-component system, chemotaxis family, chemotaxis protein CheY
MINLDDELAQEYLGKFRKQLGTLEADLLAIEKGRAEIDEQLVNRVIRVVHSVRGAGFLGLLKIRDLANRMEDVLVLILCRDMFPKPNRVDVLRRAGVMLHELIENPGMSDQADTTEIMAALSKLHVDHSPVAGQALPSATRPLRVLVVEDDFASRLLLQTCLSRYGECHISVNGREAVEGFRSALERKQKYDLVCMDIMMPEMDGIEALKQVRAIEQSCGIFPNTGAKIVMTTAVEDIREVIRCFEEFCDAYLLKPIDLDKLRRQMRSFGLLR